MQDPARIHLSAATGEPVDIVDGDSPPAVTVLPSSPHVIDLGDVSDAWRGMNQLEYSVAVITETVISWTLTDVHGRPLPVTRSGVLSDDVPSAILRAVVDEIMDYYEAQEPDPTKRS